MFGLNVEYTSSVRLNFTLSVRLKFYTQFLKLLNAFHLHLNFASFHYQQFSIPHLLSKQFFTMLSKQFEINEFVDAIDECFIWWLAEIIKFNGEWEVVVRWIEFGNRKSTITIPSTIRKTSWNIRRTKVTPQSSPCKRSHDNKIQLNYRAKFQSRGDTIRFRQGDTVQKGFVSINDTVIQEMEILEEDENKKWEKSTEEYDKLTTSFRTLRIRYNDLRRLPVPVNTGMEEKDDCSDESDAESTQMSQPKKQTKVAGHKKKTPVNMISMIPVSLKF